MGYKIYFDELDDITLGNVEELELVAPNKYDGSFISDRSHPNMYHFENYMINIFKCKKLKKLSIYYDELYNVSYYRNNFSGIINRLDELPYLNDIDIEVDYFASESSEDDNDSKFISFHDSNLIIDHLKNQGLIISSDRIKKLKIEDSKIISLEITSKELISIEIHNTKFFDNKIYLTNLNNLTIIDIDDVELSGESNEILISNNPKLIDIYCFIHDQFNTYNIMLENLPNTKSLKLVAAVNFGYLFVDKMYLDILYLEGLNFDDFDLSNYVSTDVKEIVIDDCSFENLYIKNIKNKCNLLLYGIYSEMIYFNNIKNLFTVFNTIHAEKIQSDSNIIIHSPHKILNKNNEVINIPKNINTTSKYFYYDNSIIKFIIYKGRYFNTLKDILNNQHKSYNTYINNHYSKNDQVFKKI